MDKVRSFWEVMGKRTMAAGLILIFVVSPFMLLEIFDFRVIALLLLGCGHIAAGLILLITSKAGDKKLANLKEIGRAIKPEKVNIRFRLLTPHAFGKDTYRSFYVECVLINAKGDEITVKSRRLAVCYGVFGITPLSARALFDAMVYIDPYKAKSYAIEVWAS